MKWPVYMKKVVCACCGIRNLAAFFNRLGMPKKLTEFDIDPYEGGARDQERFEDRGTVLGEHKDLTPDKVAEILKMSQ